MSKYVLKSKSIVFEYGCDEGSGEYYFKVYDMLRKNINNGLIDFGGSKSTNMPPIVFAEKLKRFKAPVEHIQKVLWMRKI